MFARTLLRVRSAVKPQTFKVAAFKMAPAPYRLFCESAAEASGEPGRVKGICKWFDSKKGFGFITPDDGTPDVFVHQTQIHAPGFRNLADGEPVEFVMEKQEDGKLRAVSVTGPDGAYVQGAPRPSPISRNDDWNF